MSISSPPEIVFIIPYRDREQQKSFFIKQMKNTVLEDMTEGKDYEMYFVHQNDERVFNRGAMKNIGFLAIKHKYPNDYKNITFVFNDVDTMPFTKGFINYKTSKGIVKHFFGYNYTLGGIVSITGEDFEETDGYPCLWQWGFEDNEFQNRVMKAPNMKIDRSQFYPIHDKNILKLNDSMFREVNRAEFDRYINGTKEGVHSLRNLKYKFEDEYIQVMDFHTDIEENPLHRSIWDLRKGNKPFDITPPTLKTTKTNRRPSLNMNLDVPNMEPISKPRRIGIKQNNNNKMSRVEIEKRNKKTNFQMNLHSVKK